MESSRRRICRQCHALVADEPDRQEWTACPACGGRLAADPSAPGAGAAKTAETAKTAEFDRRGIVLPSRHAVGGIISPR